MIDRTTLPTRPDIDTVRATLVAGGFVAADDEAAQLIDAAAIIGTSVGELLARRLTGEPLAWITGTATFAGEHIVVVPGVYVPRHHSERLARRASELLPEDGIAIDVCTGSGAIGAVIARQRPGATVIGVDIDATSVHCAAVNGLDVRGGHLLQPVDDLTASVDVIVGVVPYVPTSQLDYLQRDTLTFESTLAYDGGQEGTTLLHDVAAWARTLLRRGGHLLLEVGIDQAEAFVRYLDALGYRSVRRIADDEGDVRAVEACWVTSGRDASHSRVRHR